MKQVYISFYEGQINETIEEYYKNEVSHCIDAILEELEDIEEEEKQDFDIRKFAEEWFIDPDAKSVYEDGTELDGMYSEEISYIVELEEKAIEEIISRF